MNNTEYNNIINEVDFFHGIEVQNTPTFGLNTLFVVGIQEVDVIIDNAIHYNCDAIYFGKNQSFNAASVEEWNVWENMIRNVLDHPNQFWCSLDIDSNYILELHESGLTENHRFIPVISVKLPYIELLNYNTVLKFDDIDFDKTNAGIWCHRLHDIMDTNKFTHCKELSTSEIIS